MNERIFTVVNPVSGNGKTGKIWPDYERLFLDQGLQIDSTYTLEPDHATRLVREAINKGYKMIMAVGGDGTINEVVNGFFYQGQIIDPAVKLITFSQGTGSDYIRSLGISRRAEELTRIIKGKRVSFFDLGKVTYVTHFGERACRYFVNIADAGIGAETAYLVNQNSKRMGGLISYLVGLLKTLKNYENKLIELTVDGYKVLSEIINSVIIANGEFFGGGMQIAPEADLKDGFFNIIILKDLNRFEIITNLIKAYRGNHLSHPKIDVVYGREINIDSKERVLIEMDGEVIGRLPASFEILDRKLPVMVV